MRHGIWPPLSSAFLVRGFTFVAENSILALFCFFFFWVFRVLGAGSRRPPFGHAPNRAIKAVFSSFSIFGGYFIAYALPRRIRPLLDGSGGYEVSLTFR